MKSFESFLADYRNDVRSVLIMAVEIKTFEFVRHYYQKIEIHPSQPDQNGKISNWKNVLIIVIAIRAVILVGAYFQLKAKRLDQMGMSFYVSVSAVCQAIYFVSMIWQNGKILKLIEKFR